jgi:hypothetical protein
MLASRFENLSACFLPALVGNRVGLILVGLLGLYAMKMAKVGSEEE